MKLFITNKPLFDEQFDSCTCNALCQRECLGSKLIHILTFNKLKNEVEVNNSIPLIIFQKYDNGEGIAIFDFVTKKGDVYYYEFTGTAS